MTSFLSFFFASSIGINILAAILIGYSGIRSRKSYFKTLSIGCFLAMFYQAATWQYHSSSELNDAIFWLSLQTTLVIVSVPPYFFVFAQWSQFPKSHIGLYILCGISTIFLLINWYMPYSIRFEEMPEVISYPLFTGETVYRLIGQSSPAMALLHVYGMVVIGILIVIVRRLFNRGQKVVATLLIATLFVQMLATVVSVLIEKQAINFVYMGGLPFTLLNVLACITIAAALDKRSESLTKQIAKRESLESVLFGLARGVSSIDSEKFYNEMLIELQRVSGANMAYIAETKKYEEQYIMRTKSVVLDGKIAKNFSYRLSDVPQALSKDDVTVIIERDLYTRYPQVDLFNELKAVGYIGVPMKITGGSLEGVLVLLYCNKIEPDEALIKTIEVFGSRAAAECRRDKLETDLRQMAYYDYKTKLPNLTQFNEELNYRVTTNAMSGTQSALIVINLDGFSEVNRKFGFDSAELVLATLGARFNEYADDRISIARTGGDVFAILIKEISGNSDVMLATYWSAIHSLVNAPIQTGFSEIKIKCTGGAVIFPKQTTEQMSALRCAEFALREAKKSQRNQLKLFDAKILEEIHRKQRVEQLLALAIAGKKDLFLVYQPKVDQQGNLKGAEALCRWVSDELGFVSPVEFIEIAESSGLIYELGIWCIETVCVQLNAWQSSGFDMPGRISINISSLQLEHENFIDYLMDTLNKHKIKPTQIDIELTESGLLKNVKSSIETLKKLQEIGFTVSLDDFGTGYSSLAYLNDLPLDCLKIDRSFVNHVEDKNKELVESIISIGRHMQLEIVAEGVEELSQVNVIAAMGCPVFQGYYFSKPLSAEELPNYSHTVIEGNN